jgi:predicted short-subunit dehydrogenase-like oxidoreductase (DUF2520 family)
MDIILIGSGNTATILGRRSLSAGHRISQVYSRTEDNAGRLALQLDAEPVSSVSGIGKKADLMIIAIRDEAILPFMQAVQTVAFPVAHTAGAVPRNEIKNPGNAYGVLYPLQSLRKEIEIIPPLTLLVDGNSPHSLEIITEFASTIAKTVIVANDEVRMKYHLAATLVNNFTNFLFVLAEKFCKKEQISFHVLQPLIEETILRLRELSPAEVQTGPAIRNDLQTIKKHSLMLKDYPELLRIYEMFTEEIRNFYVKK